MQKDSQVARRYAKSLLDFAIERNELDAVAADMALIANTCQSSRDLVVMLKSPIIKTEKKVAVINKVFSGEIGSASVNFINVVAKGKREMLLPEIAIAFTTLYRSHKGIVSAEITSAIPLSELEREKAKSIVAGLGKEVELTEKIDKSIIGGFIIRVGDKQYDASVASRLSDVKQALS